MSRIGPDVQKWIIWPQRPQQVRSTARPGGERLPQALSTIDEHTSDRRSCDRPREALSGASSKPSGVHPVYHSTTSLRGQRSALSCVVVVHQILQQHRPAMSAFTKRARTFHPSIHPSFLTCFLVHGYIMHFSDGRTRKQMREGSLRSSAQGPYLPLT